MLDIFYCRPTAIVFGTALFDTFWLLWKLSFFEENIFTVFLYLCCFFYPKTIDFHNSGIVGNVPSSGLQYTLSFKWPDFGLRCLITITPKGSTLKFKASVWNFHISETGKNYNSLYKLADNNRDIIMEQKRKIEYSWTCTFRAS